MIRDSSYAVRLFSLLFRPLFFDANGLFALIASVENLFTLFLFGFMLWNWKKLWWLARRVFFLRFSLIFAVAIILLLTLVAFNVGIGSRQKSMAYPAIFAFFVSQWAFHRAQRWAQRRGPASQPGAFDQRTPAPLGGATMSTPK